MRNHHEADQQDIQQPGVALPDRFIDGELNIERRDESRQLHEQRKDENLGERAAEIAQPAPKVAEPGARAGLDRLEIGGRG